MKRGINVKSPRRAFNQNRVNVPGMSEAIWQPLYDYQTLAAAGANTQRFFIDPVGTGGKTLADTNMELAGQIPKGQAFLITGIQVELYPGVNIGSAAASSFADDIYQVYQDGLLVLQIGSKDFVTQGNLMKFAPVNRLAMNSAVTETAAATTRSYLYATAAGREFAIKDLLLESNQNFSIELRELAALPSGADARIGVTLNGFLYRNAQ